VGKSGRAYGKKRFVGELRLQLLAIGSMKHRCRAIR
jgi:hypothetical protein